MDRRALGSVFAIGIGANPGCGMGKLGKVEISGSTASHHNAALMAMQVKPRVPIPRASQ